MTDHDIAVEYEEGFLNSSDDPVFTDIVRQDFRRLSIKLPDTISVTRKIEESNTLMIGGVEDGELRAKIANFTTSTLVAFKTRGCRIVRIRVSAISSNSQVENTSGTPTQLKTTRPLPTANHKASGFAAYRGNVAKGSRSSVSGSTLSMGTPTSKGISSSQPMGLTRSLTGIPLSPRPQSLPRPSRSFTLYSDTHVPSSPLPSMPSSKFKGKKRKLDDSEVSGEIQIDDDDEIVILGISGPGGTQSTERNTGVESEMWVTPNKANISVVEDKGRVITNGPGDEEKVRDLLKAALEKHEDGEKKRMELEAHLRQQITSLEGRLQQETDDHNISKKRVHHLEQRLMATTSNVTQINALLRAISIQLVGLGPETVELE